jgi:protein-tyrosine phosphatase
MNKTHSTNAASFSGCNSLQHVYTDVHCHCLPGMDDGPTSMANALALCAALVEDGIKTVVATPHQLGRFEGRNRANEIRRNVCELNEQLQIANIQLNVLPGADVRVDERICHLLHNDGILTLADGGKYLLLELPHDVFIDIELLLKNLVARGVIPVISHPERHRVLAAQPEIISKWLSAGACIQITAASLIGKFGQFAQHAGWYLINSGLAHIVATDAHGLEYRCPLMRAAYNKISQNMGEDISSLLCIENPERIVKGEKLINIKEQIGKI